MVLLLLIASLFTEYPLTAAALVVLSERIVAQATPINLAGWTVCALAANAFYPAALVGLLPLLASFFSGKLNGSRWFRWRWFGYVFYPAHLGLLLLVRAWIGTHP